MSGSKCHEVEELVTANSPMIYLKEKKPNKKSMVVGIVVCYEEDKTEHELTP
jgi:hypothetical protein